MNERIENADVTVELDEANESVFRFVAYWSSYLLWSVICVVGVMIAFIN